MGFTEIYERIKLATNCRTQVELAELLNIRQSSISDAKRRDSVPGDWYMKLFERFGLNPDWLKYGVGPLYLRTDKGYCPQEAPQALAETVACYGDDFTRSTVVDVYDMACIYTDEAPRPALSVSGRVPLPQAFLRPSLQVLRLRGQAMEPLLREGAYIGVDMEDLAPVSGQDLRPVRPAGRRGGPPGVSGRPAAGLCPEGPVPGLPRNVPGCRPVAAPHAGTCGLDFPGGLA